MVNTRELKNLTAKLFATCEKWKEPAIDPSPVEDILVLDIALFVLHLSADPIKTARNMDWLKEEYRITVESIISAKEDLPTQTVDFKPPFIIRTFWFYREFAEDRKPYSDVMESFYDYFNLLGQWIIREDSKRNSKALLSEYLEAARDFINKPSNKFFS